MNVNNIRFRMETNLLQRNFTVTVFQKLFQKSLLFIKRNIFVVFLSGVIFLSLVRHKSEQGHTVPGTKKADMFSREEKYQVYKYGKIKESLNENEKNKGYCDDKSVHNFNINTFLSMQDQNHLYPVHYDVTSVLCNLSLARLEKVELFGPEEEMLQSPDSNESLDLGSNPKWLLYLEGGIKAVFKAAWHPRDYVHTYWYEGYELPTSEIASFHIDRLLGFRRVPPTVGRRLHIRSKVLPVASKALRRALFKKGDEYCLTGRCYLCEYENVTCTSRGYIEGSVQLYLKSLSRPIENPWGVKHYHIETGQADRCESRRKMSPVFSQDHHYLNLVDLSILDYVTYHFDSKYYFVRAPEKSRDLAVYIDRGRALTRADKDDDINLLPLSRCCRLRNSTWHNIKQIARTPDVLTHSLAEELAKDQLSYRSILAPQHYSAISRRIKKLPAYVQRCLHMHGITKTIEPG